MWIWGGRLDLFAFFVLFVQLILVMLLFVAFLMVISLLIYKRGAGLLGMVGR